MGSEQTGLVQWAEPVEPPETLSIGERFVMRMADGILNWEYKRIQAKTIQDIWASWAKLKNKLASHAWEPLRPIYGYKGHQKVVKPGPPARGRSPTE